MQRYRKLIGISFNDLRSQLLPEERLVVCVIAEGVPEMLILLETEDLYEREVFGRQGEQILGIGAVAASNLPLG